MTIDEAIAIIGVPVQNNSYEDIQSVEWPDLDYNDWGLAKDQITLDGGFTVDQLEAIVNFMRGRVSAT